MNRLLSLFLASLTLLGCTQNQIQVVDDVAIIAPHHLLVANQLQEFYNGLIFTDIDKVIIISPNHFGYGYNSIQTSQKGLNTDQDFVNELQSKGLAYIEETRFSKEHGITAHYNFVNKTFPNTPITPITIKNETPQAHLDKLASALATSTNSFIIASIDFTHYTTEEIALKNDERTQAYLAKWQSGHNVEYQEVKDLAISIKDGVAMDSPETFYVLLKTLELRGIRKYQPWLRTSSLSLIGAENPELQTSHIFARF